MNNKKNIKKAVNKKAKDNHKNIIKNIIYIIIVIFIILLIFILSQKTDKKDDSIFNFSTSDYSNITAIGLSEYEASLIYEGTSVILFCSNEEEKCQEEVNALNEIGQENNLTFEYLNILELVDSEITELENTSDIFKESKYPHLIIIKEGNIVNNNNEYLNKNAIENVLKEYEII